MRKNNNSTRHKWKSIGYDKRGPMLVRQEFFKCERCGMEMAESDKRRGAGDCGK